MFTCCQEASAKAEEFVNEAQEKGLSEATKELAQDAKEKVQEIVEDAKSGKLMEDIKEAASGAADALQGAAEAVVAAVDPVYVTIVFETADKKILEVKFDKRVAGMQPLGFEYGFADPPGCCTSAKPGKYKVTKVTNKELTDLKVDMLIKKINSDEIHEKMEIGELRQLMDAAIKTLPEPPKPPPKEEPKAEEPKEEAKAEEAK